MKLRTQNTAVAVVKLSGSFFTVELEWFTNAQPIPAAIAAARSILIFNTAKLSCQQRRWTCCTEKPSSGSCRQFRLFHSFHVWKSRSLRIDAMTFRIMPTLARRMGWTGWLFSSGDIRRSDWKVSFEKRGPDKTVDEASHVHVRLYPKNRLSIVQGHMHKAPPDSTDKVDFTAVPQVSTLQGAKPALEACKIPPMWRSHIFSSSNTQDSTMMEDRMGKGVEVERTLSKRFPNRKVSRFHHMWRRVRRRVEPL